MPKVSFTYEIPEIAEKKLKDAGFDVWVNREERTLTHEEIINLAKESDALITLLSDNINKEVLEAGKGKLKVVSNYAVGYNNIDVESAKEFSIYVTNTPGVLSDATADLAWALLFAVARKIVESDKFVREGKFIGWRPQLFLGYDIKGKTLGIIGMGRIGKEMAKRALGFDMKVLYYKRNRLSEAEEKELNVEYAPLEELIKKSDYISLHTPLTPETHHLLDEKEFSMMKPNVIIINTARGPVINEKVLIKYLKEGKIAGAGLDVYEEEPKIPEELLKLDNVVLTPHTGSATFETRDKMAEMVADNVIAALKGEVPPNNVY
ncbi:glyoxylate reductase [Marinitoga sp. 1135]|uniref:Lactate dehydrogenase-like oxidoreductase n=1 Tax=Marinitoga piezophila (strain DSM 14283 / JCM 11233 / KA3) TaxID=443254 RepID=H2J748_MARPK|nr:MULTISPECIES: D-glycerate dehydrogenase [Marinitoga]AEX86418.1 lactate dehydrogenase-like oxidoreductase [Marinitoga piezophila KA3]APT76807.1 glyoxylate reductase [Marinitoga sp. 1137]NUU96575.1 glyoxylate reductase [Marinitoga sp. 1135]